MDQIKAGEKDKYHTSVWICQIENKDVNETSIGIIPPIQKKLSKNDAHVYCFEK